MALLANAIRLEVAVDETLNVALRTCVAGQTADSARHWADYGERAGGVNRRCKELYKPEEQTRHGRTSAPESGEHVQLLERLMWREATIPSI
ncbi:hypothetical protein WK68_14840 [Burkholderia ubonensis]|nr:hypothetical protein WK68_14840 [Burkholderia ubonensis]